MGPVEYAICDILKKNLYIHCDEWARLSTVKPKSFVQATNSLMNVHCHYQNCIALTMQVTDHV